MRAAWVDWYEARLSGSSQSEATEMIYSRVARAVWETGATASNLWINTHLAKISLPEVGGERGTSQMPALPAAVFNQAALHRSIRGCP